jgi:hypothetical protein
LDLSVEEFQKRLEAISDYQGIPFGRVNLLFDEEQTHAEAALRYKGFLVLSDAFKAFVFETVERFNSEIRPKISAPLSEHYPQFVPRITQSFRTLCASERVSLNGYPYHGYTLLRNEFDSSVLTSACLQGITDFYKISGLNPGQPYDEKEAKRLRKNTEFEVRNIMTGSKSGLSEQTIAELERLNALFDFETHGSHLSLTHAKDWMKGTKPLPLTPKFEERAFALFMNRFCEIAWMMHRLLPMIQPKEWQFAEDWKEKWRIIDDSFKYLVRSLTSENKLPVGSAVVEFVETKFPFNENTGFPL